MGGNERYVKVRPNPEALTHIEIFGRLVGHGAGVIAGGGPDGPTGPFFAEGRRLEAVLDDLATMVSGLGASYQAESIEPAASAIQAMRRHMTTLGEHASQLAREFDGYVGQYYQVRSRMPEPVPFAAQLDAAQAHHPGLLAQVPFVAELQEEHELRTREARELYRQLDQAAVATDDATPEFPLLADTTTNDVDVAHAEPTGPAASWPSGARGSTSVASTGPVETASASLGSVAPAVSAPAAMPGASAGGLGSTRMPGASRASGAEPWPGLPVSPPGRGIAGDWRAGQSNGGAPGQAGARRFAAGSPQHDVISRRSVTGLWPDGRVGGGGVPAEQLARAAPARGAGSGPALGPAGPMTPADQQDREHRRPSFLEADDDPDALFGTDQRVAHPVLGEFPPGTDYWRQKHVTTWGE